MTRKSEMFVHRRVELEPPRPLTLCPTGHRKPGMRFVGQRAICIACGQDVTQWLAALVESERALGLHHGERRDSTLNEPLDGR